MVRINTHPAVIRLLFSIVIVLVVLATFAGASAQEPPAQIKLGIAPVNVEGNFFDLTIEPGETRQLAVELSNHGTTTVSARTFAADGYTIHGGGFGARLDGEPTTGTTLWLDYPTDTMDIEASKGILRTFSISVPADIVPGEYITSLVIQNAVPIDGDGDGVSLKQVNRQVIAVNITVPGEMTPGLTIGGVAHHVAGIVSIVSFKVRNTGAVHLKPAGEFVLRDSDGVEVTRYPIAMDSFYAGTDTEVEVPFSTHLNEGVYTATLSLNDTEHNVSASSGDQTLDVPKAVETIIVPAGDGSGAAAASQQAPNQTESGFPLWIVFVVIGSIVIGIGIGFIMLRFMMASKGRDASAVSVNGQDPATTTPLIPRTIADQDA